MTKYCVIKINEEYSAIDSRYIKIIGIYKNRDIAIDNILSVIDWQVDNNGTKYINYVNGVSNEKVVYETVYKKLYDDNIANHLDIDADISLIYRIVTMDLNDN